MPIYKRICCNCNKEEILKGVVRSIYCLNCSMKLFPRRKGKSKGVHMHVTGYLIDCSLPKGSQYIHRYLMEQKIGRKLKRNEHVHHINGITTDNRIENLEILSCKEHHIKHSPKDKMKRLSILGHKKRWGYETNVSDIQQQVQ